MDKKTLDFEKKIKELKLQYLASLPSKCDSIEQMILNLESGERSDESLSELARQVHSLKGTAGTYGYKFVTTICHNFEDYFTLASVSNSFDKKSIRRLLAFVELLREYAKSRSQNGTKDTV